MKLKTQTPQKGKKNAAVNGLTPKIQKTGKVQKSTMAMKPSAVSKAVKKQNSVKKILQPKKKMIEVQEDEDEEDESNEDEEISPMSTKESEESENEEVAENGPTAEAETMASEEEDAEEDDNVDDGEEVDEDEEDDAVEDDDGEEEEEDAEENEEEEVENGNGLIDHEAEEAEDDDDNEDGDDDDNEDEDDDDNEGADDDENVEQENEDGEVKIPTKGIQKVPVKKPAKPVEPEVDDSDDEAPEEAPATKKPKVQKSSESAPLIDFSPIQRDIPNDHVIYIKNLPPFQGYELGDVVNVFSKYGTITAIHRLSYQNETNALLAFTSAEAAAAALEANQKAKIKGHLLGVSLKTPTRKELSAFVGNLNSGISVDDIREHFAQVGVINKINYVGAKNKRLALIEFPDEETLKKALLLNNSKLKDATLEVRRVFLESGPRDVDHTIVLANPQNLRECEEEKLRRIFGECGPIRNVEIKCRPHQLAFISFENPKDVEKALALNGKTVEELELNITKYGLEKPNSNLIFITNVHNATEEYLRELFSKCGTINSVTINQIKKTATVQFNDTDAFCKSFLLNEHYINRKPIFIEPFSFKKKLSAPKGPHMNNFHTKGFKKPGQFNKFGKKPPNWGPQKSGAPFYRQGGKFGNNRGPGFKKFPAMKPSTNEGNVATPTSIENQDNQTKVEREPQMSQKVKKQTKVVGESPVKKPTNVGGETPMKTTPKLKKTMKVEGEVPVKKTQKVKKQTQNTESSGPQSAVKRPKTQKDTDGVKNPKKIKKMSAE